MAEFSSGRGGARPGAGRPKGSHNDVYSKRTQRQYRATDEEHELVKRFIVILRKNPERAKEIINMS